MKKPLLQFSLLAGLVFLCLTVYEGYEVWETRMSAINTTKAEARDKTLQAAREFNADLKRFVPLIDGLAEDLSAGRLQTGGVLGRLEALMKRYPELPSIGAAFEPFAFSRDRRLYAPYLMRTANTVRQIAIERFSDYTQPGIGWYGDRLRQGPGWDKPAWGEAAGALMATYSAPFFRRDQDGTKVPAGVVYVSVPLDWIQKRVDALKMGSTGWGAVLSKQGDIIAGPSRSKNRALVNVFDFARAAKNDVLLKVAERMTRGERGTAEYRSVLTGEIVYAFYEPIPETGWSLGVLVVADEIPFNARDFRRGIIRTYAALLASIVFLSLPLAAVLYQLRPLITLWSIVALSVVLFTGGIAMIRFLPQDDQEDRGGKSVMIVDRSGLGSFLRSREEADTANRAGDPVYIPAGLYLHSMDFTSAHNILVSGFLWQEIPGDVRNRVDGGFVLPQAINATVVETYRKKEGNHETIGWSFKATLWQNVDYSKYPFDRVNTGIRLWHKDFYRNVILVPALDSYELMNPAALPGIDNELRLSGWKIKKSFFSYETGNYKTDFGLPEYLAADSFPQLQFNVALERNLLDALVSNMIPLAIVSLMLFAVLVNFTKDKDELKAVGFNPSTVLRVTSGLFFVVLLAHIHLRTTVAAQEVSYLEYYFFTLYVAIFAVSLHSFLMSSNRIHVKLLDYEHSLIPKLLFWPLLLGAQFLVTVLVFY